MNFPGYKSEFLIFFAVFIIFSSCRGRVSDRQEAAVPGKKDMEEVNRFLVQKDREVIMNYIERKNLIMNESSSGLWYQVTEPGEGELLKSGDRVLMDFDCSLLDGTHCYSSSEQGQKEIILGKTELESGMNEGLKMLRPGAEAVFILPPFLAYGLVGDGKKIPPRSTIVYHVRIAR